MTHLNTPLLDLPPGVTLSVGGTKKFFMAAHLLVFDCTEIAKSIAWPHGDCLVVSSNSFHRLPTKQFFAERKLLNPIWILGCLVRGKGEM